MNLHNRRTFIGSSLAGLTAAATGYGQNVVEVAPPPRPINLVPSDLTIADTLFLTWQGDPTTTMTVQWVAPHPLTYQKTPLEATVRFAPFSVFGFGYNWAKVPTVTRPFPKTDLTVFRAQLTGLTPGTEYIFQVGTTGPVHRFRTMPAKATDTFTFISGGDSGVNPHAIANNILAAKQEPQFVLIAGDLGYDNGVSEKTALGFLRNYAQTMIDPKGRLIPLVTCLGNHEVRGGYKAKRADATFFMPLFDGLYPEKTYTTLDFGDYLSLVLLDTGHISPIGGEQADWLERTLKERAERSHLFVANHVPAYPSYRNPIGTVEKFGTGEENRKFWCPLFENYGVDAVLEHHDHTFKRTHPLKDGLVDKYGVTYLGDGSWGMLRPPVPPEKRPYLYKVSKSYHFTVHNLEGESRYHVALEEGGRIADMFSTTGKRPARRG